MNKNILRIIGAIILALILIIIGANGIKGPIVLLMTFGFAVGYELIVVKLFGEK